MKVCVAIADVEQEVDDVLRVAVRAEVVLLKQVGRKRVEYRISRLPDALRRDAAARRRWHLGRSLGPPAPAADLEEAIVFVNDALTSTEVR